MGRLRRKRLAIDEWQGGPLYVFPKGSRQVAHSPDWIARQDRHAPVTAKPTVTLTVAGVAQISVPVEIEPRLHARIGQAGVGIRQVRPAIVESSERLSVEIKVEVGKEKDIWCDLRDDRLDRCDLRILALGDVAQ